MGWGVWDVGTPDLSQRVLDRTGPDRTVRCIETIGFEPALS